MEIKIVVAIAYGIMFYGYFNPFYPFLQNRRKTLTFQHAETIIGLSANRSKAICLVQTPQHRHFHLAIRN